ncbi:hypothetical protein EJB05_17689, partial [Eragrostis curvula]
MVKIRLKLEHNTGIGSQKLIIFFHRLSLPRREKMGIPILLFSVILLLSSPVALCGCYKRIFSFGDSIIDTGNFAYTTGNSSTPVKEPPYGMTYFHHPTGRVSDGRVLVDFYAQAFNLPLVPPSIPEQNSGQFPTGANFAYLGATALPPDYYKVKYNFEMGGSSNLGMQLDSFKTVLARIAPGPGVHTVN